MTKPYTVTVVCTGNICRSPIAEVLLREAFDHARLGDRVQVNSAGTGRWHLGHDMDHRARAVLEGAGHVVDLHEARQFRAEDLPNSDLILAADVSHHRALREMAPDEETASKVRLLMEFHPDSSHADDLNLADPYYGDDRDFILSYDAVLGAVPGVVHHVRTELSERERRATSS